MPAGSATKPWPARAQPVGATGELGVGLGTCVAVGSGTGVGLAGVVPTPLDDGVGGGTGEALDACEVGDALVGSAVGEAE